MHWSRFAQVVKIKPVPSVMSNNDQHKNLKLQVMLCNTYTHTNIQIHTNVYHTHTRFLLKFAVCVNHNNPDNVHPRSLTNSHTQKKKTTLPSLGQHSVDSRHTISRCYNFHKAVWFHHSGCCLKNTQVFFFQQMWNCPSGDKKNITHV